MHMGIFEWQEVLNRVGTPITDSTTVAFLSNVFRVEPRLSDVIEIKPTSNNRFFFSDYQNFRVIEKFA